MQGGGDAVEDEYEDDFSERSTCDSLLEDGSMQLAGIVQECIEVYTFFTRPKAKSSNKGVLVQRKRKLNDDKIHISRGTEPVDFTNSVVHLKLLLKKFEDLLMRAFEREYPFRVKVLSLLVLLLKFISKTRLEFIKEVRKGLGSHQEEQEQTLRVNARFINVQHLKKMTQLLCYTLNQARIKSNALDVQILLNLFLDSLEVVMEGVAQSIHFDCELVREWVFLLTIPWLRKMGHIIPSCQTVPGLNLLCKANEKWFDMQLKERCILLLRFEIFFPFRNIAQSILRDIILSESPNVASEGVLDLITGFWWPCGLLSWRQLLKYNMYLLSQNIRKRHDEEFTVLMAEAFVQLPCAYANKTINAPRLLPRLGNEYKGCVVCNVSLNRFEQTSLPTVRMPKIKQGDITILLGILNKMLSIRNARVHFTLINILHSLRVHTKLNLLQFTEIFWNIFNYTNSAVQAKMIDIFGYCTRDYRRVVKLSSLSLTWRNTYIERMKRKKNLAKGKKESDQNKRGRPHEQLVDTDSPKELREKYVQQSSNSALPGSSKDAKFKSSNTSSGASADSGILFLSQKDIVTRSRSAFPSKPPDGRFDAATILYTNFLYKYYLSSGKSSADEEIWITLVDFHSFYMNWARHADSDVLAVEILRLCLHLLANNLDMANAIILTQRIFTCLATRANCLPWELCARYKDIVSNEMKVICQNKFFHGKPRLGDRNAIQLCNTYFLRVSIALDLSRKVMTTTFLRLIVKQCVQNMFQNTNDHTLVCAISEFACSKSIQEFLEEEFAYYYPNALLNCDPKEVEVLLQHLQQNYKFDPSSIIKLNSQFLHIELVSHIFEYRDQVLQKYTYLMEWDDETRRTSSKKVLHRSIGESLDKLYIGIFLYFDSKFRTRAESRTSKRRYLGCFAMLISLLGKKRVTSSKLKLYSMLNSLRTLGPDYHDLVFQAWKQFISNLEEASLRSMVNQICASITYLRSSKPIELDSIFKLILGKESVVQDDISSLHFLLRVTRDSEIRPKLKQIICALSYADLFHQLVGEVGSENAHVRFRAVQRIQDLLERKFEHIRDLKFDQHLFASSATKLLKNLLKASKEAKTEKMRILCASCIGLLGALDPRRFDLTVQLTTNAKFGLTIFTVGEDDFVVYFIEELTKVLRSSVDTRHFDACALSLQEVIKMYCITQSDSDHIWPRLTAKAKDLLIPLFTSKYSKSEHGGRTEISGPVYLSQLGTTFGQWMYNWSLRMVSVVTTDSISEFFSTVLTIVEKSDRIGLVLLPYIASYALIEGGQEGVKVFLQEVDAVLSQWVSGAKLHLENLTPAVADPQLRPGRSKKVQSETFVSDRKNGFSYAAAQAVFKVLDHLTRLVRNPLLPQKRMDICFSQTQTAERFAAVRNQTLDNADIVDSALKKLRYDILSKAAFVCRNYARSLMYMEQHLNAKESDFDRCFENLQRVYVALLDEDSVKGLETNRKQDITVMEEALNKLSQGKLEPCMPLFETIVGQNPDDLLVNQQLVYAYLGLNQFSLGDMLVNGSCSRNLGWKRSFDEAKLEISLLQNDSKALTSKIQELSSEKLSSWGLAVSKSFLHFNGNDMTACKTAVQKSSLDLISEIGTGAAWLDMGFYFRHYQDFIRLQLLTELEEIASLVEMRSKTPGRCKQKFQLIQSNWDRRIKCAYKSTEVLRPILSFRKSLLEMSNKYFVGDSEMPTAIGVGIRDCYVKLAKLETGLGNFVRASQLFLEMKLKSSSSIYYEEAKMLFEAEKHDECLKILDVELKETLLGVNDKFPVSTLESHVTPEQRRFSKACLLYARQLDDQRKVDMIKNIKSYEYAIEMNRRSEKNYFYMACYYDRLFSQAEHKMSDFQVLTVKNYGLSLTHGCKYIYQSLPRILRFWFDYSQVNKSGSRSSGPCPDTIMQLTEAIGDLLERAPTYIFIVVFSQLISRLIHINNVVYNQLKNVLARMIVVHPDQVLWMIISVLKSTYKKRVARCNEILLLAEKTNPKLKMVIRNYKMLADKLIAFTNKKPENSRFAKISDILPQLGQLIKSKEFSQVLIPFQDFMRPVLPRAGKYVQMHNPFPEQLIYIADISEPVLVMHSLQKPKRITLKGTDGKSYSIMCKPSDDLRKDAKVMEINNMVQWYMNGDKESRKRNLSLRTYNVTPLSDTCGILEWIPNLHGYRPLINSLCKEIKGLQLGLKQIRGQICDRRDSIVKKRQMFKDVLVANHPVVMFYWFLKSFQDPQSWYMARTSYVKTAAVMSIIGFLMGLGDRHGENILLDSSNGQVVHVDFNCLFNKGETFDWPERVPFRLTRNMLNAMGPLGYEGMFRCSCEIVMRLLRNHSSVFLSIIRPFIFDPLLEWESNINAAEKDKLVGEVCNPRAVEHLNDIRDRLLGITRNMTKERNVALSVEAHVNYLIQEATKLDNLCQMYIGWAGYM